MVADTEPAPLSAAVPGRSVVPLDRLTLVLVARPSPARWVLRRTLERTGGFDVLAEETDASSCLAAVRDQAPDAVVIDIDIDIDVDVDVDVETVAGAGAGPGPDGRLDLARELGVSRPGVPVVVLVSPQDPHQLERALRSGAVGVVNRDAGPVEVVAQVRAVLTAPWRLEHPALA